MSSTAIGSTQSAVQALGALAQETRLSVFRSLVQAGPGGLAAGQLGERARVAPSALTFHMKSLTGAGLVTSTKNGRFVIYRANFTAMDSLLQFLTENCCTRTACPVPAKSRSK